MGLLQQGSGLVEDLMDDAEPLSQVGPMIVPSLFWVYLIKLIDMLTSRIFRPFVEFPRADWGALMDRSQRIAVDTSVIFFQPQKVGIVGGVDLRCHGGAGVPSIGCDHLK